MNSVSYQGTSIAAPITTQSPDHKLAAAMGRSAAFGIVARVAQVVTRLVTIPIVISHLGLGGYGIWAIIMTAAAYMRFGSIGIKSAFQKYVAEASETRQYDLTNRLLSTGCLLMFVLSVVGLTPIAIYSTDLARAAGVTKTFLSQASGSISLLALIMVISNVGAVYEAIVMGSHRIDLARNLTTLFTVAEAIAFVILLHFGYGLFAMTLVMAGSELGFIMSCYALSRKIAPNVSVRLALVTKRVIPELARFGGSYQCVNALEVLYLSIIPITVLREFGAEASGVYALVTRLAGSAAMFPESLLLPLLSGGAMIYASGSSERMRVLIAKSFKVTFGLALMPLAFIAVFGVRLAYAWIGVENRTFQMSLYWVSAACLFQSISLLGLVLYRASGKALMDNLRQVLRIAILLLLAVFSRELGFYGLLVGFALSEFVGMVFMCFTIQWTYPLVSSKVLLVDAIRVTGATAIVILVGIVALRVSVGGAGVGRGVAVAQVMVVATACILSVWPALRLTKSLSAEENSALARIFRLRHLDFARRGADA